jgi:hypothetical protein
MSVPWPELAAGLHGRRLEWADRAYDQFRAALPAEVRDSLSGRRSDSNVALYGRTQVGKTTLLLTLLGVRAERLEQVGTVLRGGRNEGMSATATATVYRASSGEFWTWKVLPGDPAQAAEKVTEAQLRKRLADVRAEVESGAHRDPRKTVEIGLPAGSFGTDANFGVRILDLPGVAGSNHRERAHADELLEERISAVDMVLLVGEANKLRFLAPDELKSTALRRWVELTERFGVVLTYTYSDGNVQQWLKAGGAAGALSLEELRTKLADQLATHHDIPVPPGCDWLYPLEFGKSWERLDKSRGVSSALRAETLDCLKGALVRGTRPEARIRHAYRVRAVAEKVREEREQELDAAVTSAKRARDAARQQRDRYANTAAEHRKGIPDSARMQNVLKELQAIPSASALRPLRSDWEFAGRVEAPLDEICSALKEQFKEAVVAWQQKEAALRTELPTPVTVKAGASYRAGNALVERVPSVLERHFQSARYLIEQKLRPRYILRWRHYQGEVTAQIQAGHRAVIEELRGQLAALARDQVKSLRDRLEEHQSALQRQAQLLDAKTADAQRAFERHVAEVKNAQRRREEILSSLEAARESVSAFRRRLHRESERARSELIHEAATARDPLVALATAIAVLDHAQAYDRITGGVDG